MFNCGSFGAEGIGKNNRNRNARQLEEMDTVTILRLETGDLGMERLIDLPRIT